MKFGVTIFPTDYSISPVELARAAEERGFESLWFPDHTHVPVSRRTPYPGGGDLPKEYHDTLDPFVALGAAAAVTERLRLGTAIALMVERDPIVLAKEGATIDQISGGRFMLGIGGGWNIEEMENHGTDAARRWKLLRERTEAVKAIWTESKAEYHGEFVDFDPIYQWPKPVQKPHPPVLVGGGGPGTLKRVVRYGDGWMPIASVPREAFLAQLAELRQLAEQRGRGPLPVSAWGARAQPEVIEQFAEAGVERCIFLLPPAGAEEVLPLLDERAKLVQQFP